MTDLSVQVAGVPFKNPIIPASGVFGYGHEYEELFPLSKLGGIATKGTTITPRPGNPSPRIAETPSGMLNSVGLQNPGIDAFIDRELPYLLTKDTVILANIAGSTIEECVTIAERLDQTDVHMIELNISCPNVKKGGAAFGVHCDSAERITAAVRQATKKPLVVKLSPNVTDITEIAKAVEAAGADVEKIQTEGWSYDEFLDIVKKGTTDDCFGFVFANAGVTTKDFVSIFGVSAGITADFTNDLKYSYTSENMLKLLQAVETMTKSGYMPDYAVEAGQRLVMLETGQAMVSGKAMPLFENNVKKNIAGMSDGSAAEGSIEMEYVFLPVPVMDNVTESCYGTTDGMVVLRNNNTTEEHLKNVCEFMAFLCTGERVAAVDNELYLSCVCESGRTAQESYKLDQSELNAKATEREISLVVAPPTGITAEMSANAKTIMDEVIAPKFQSLLAGETDAQSVYDAVCTAAKEAFGEENCASGWIQ